MKRTYLKNIMLLCFMCVMFLSAGTLKVKAEEVVDFELSEESLYIMQGRVHTLSVVYGSEENATDATVTWTSSDETVVSVDENGNVFACATGKASVSATIGEVTKTCQIVVEKTQGVFSDLSSFSGKLGEKEMTEISFYVPVKCGITLYFVGDDDLGRTEGTAYILFQYKQEIVWSSEKCNIYREDTVVMCPIVFEPGQYTLLLTCSDYFFDYTGFIICDPVDVHEATAVKLNKKTKTVGIGKQFYLDGKVTPFYATSQVKWKSSNEKVATVDQYGLVTAKGMGKAVITVSTNGKKAKCTVYVTKQKLESWTGKTKNLSKQVKNVPGRKKGKWTSSNPSVASVDSKGKVTFRSHGKAKITFTAKGKKYVFTVYAYSKKKLKETVLKKLEGNNDILFEMYKKNIKKIKYKDKLFAVIVKYTQYNAWYGHVKYTVAGYYRFGKFYYVS